MLQQGKELFIPEIHRRLSFALWRSYWENICQNYTKLLVQTDSWQWCYVKVASRLPPNRQLSSISPEHDVLLKNRVYFCDLIIWNRTVRIWVTANSLELHLLDHSIIMDLKHGFRQQRSCLTKLLVTWCVRKYIDVILFEFPEKVRQSSLYKSNAKSTSSW